MKQKKIIFAPPAIESLLFKSNNSCWPDWIKDNQKIKEELSVRLSLYQQLDLLFENGYSSLDMVSVYNNLSNFIEASSFNQRLILYLPTKLIPKNPNKLELATRRFRKVYRTSWYNLLSNHELRANFSDGDTEKQDMVNKAAHLIPILLDKELITFQEIIDLLNISSDKILNDSILDTLTTIFELGLVSKTEFQLLSKSKNPLLRNVAVIAQNDVRYKRELTVIKNQADLEMIMKVVYQEVVEKNKLIRSQTSNLDRVNWQQQKEQKNILKKYADDVYNSILNGTLSIADLKKFLILQTDELSILFGIYILGKIDSSKIGCEFKLWLIEVFQKSVSIFRATESTLSYWFNLGIINQKYLESFCLKPKKIDANFSADQVMSDIELKEMSDLITSIEKDDELSRFVYPVLIVYGSRIKGYASKTTDIDLAVFVRPEVDFENFDHISKRLEKLMRHEKIKGQPLQFWLKNNHENLLVNDDISYQKTVGNSYCVHVLLGGAWLGDSKIIKKLHAELLPKYLIEDSELKNICLQELERDFLQYRLMHDGYTNFFPGKKIIDTSHSYELDSDSSFWDEGYREIATKLFVKKIFLPKKI